MKKITIFLTLLLSAIVGFGQTFDFDGTTEGFTASGSNAVSSGATALQINLAEGNSNPNIGTTSAGVSANVNHLAGVTILNSDAAGPTFMRISYPKTGGGRQYINLDIANNDSESQTYWFDLTSTDWTGTVDDIKVHFKSAGNTNYTVPVGGVLVEIDKIQFVSEMPMETRPERSEYEFDTDDEGWSNLVDAASNVESGNLMIKPDATGGIAKVTNGVYSIDADANSHVHIVYKNESADNNQVRFQFRSSVDDYTAFVGTNATISQGMSGFETLTIDLESAKPAEWSENAHDFQIAIRNTNNTGNASSSGDFIIDRVVFNNGETLTVDQFEVTEFAMYPNPATNVLNISNANELSEVEIYDLTGKRVLSVNQVYNNQISVSSLNTGLYLVKMVDNNHNTITKKLIIKR